MTILDGKKIRDELIENYKKIIQEKDLNIVLAIIQIGENPSSSTYIKNKEIFTKKVGIETKVLKLSEDIKEEECINLINQLNNDPTITGILIQSPLPNHLDFKKLSRLIIDSKDVDGLSKNNLFSIRDNKENILPCTVKGILELLAYYHLDVAGKNIVVIGRSEIVGRPLTDALINRDATVTLCHSKTKNIEMYTSQADIIISAVGKPNLINKEMVKEGFIGIDVGINKVGDKIVGDFNENVKEKASYLTPVPGGVGPMTIAMLISNLIELKKGQ